MKYKFKNGEVEGTLDQILAVAKILGESVNLAVLLGKDVRPRGYYHSSSKGLISMKEMAVPHLKNSILKITHDYFAKMRGFDGTLEQWTRKYLALTDDEQLVELFEELTTR